MVPMVFLPFFRAPSTGVLTAALVEAAGPHAGARSPTLAIRMLRREVVATSAAFAGFVPFMDLRRSTAWSLTCRACFFSESTRSLDRRCPAHNARHVPTSTDAFFAGLKSASEVERRAAMSELRAFLRGALARSFARQLS